MSRRAEISWQNPQNTGDGNIERFWIQLRKGNALILNITTNQVNKYETNNLTPFTAYEISVAAGNKHGFGEETQILLITTEEGRNKMQCIKVCIRISESNAYFEVAHKLNNNINKNHLPCYISFDF